MITQRLILEGEFLECFLYYDFAWLVNGQGDTYAFDILRYLTQRHADRLEAARAVFARNDALRIERNGSVRSEKQSHGVQDLLRSPAIQISREDVEGFSTIFDTRLSAKSILDMRCYNGRAYVAADDRVEQLNLYGRDALEKMGVGARGNGRLAVTKIHDGRCLQFRTRFGALSAACGSDGGLYATGTASREPGWRARLETFAPYSHATEFVGDTVTNLAEGMGLELYDTVRRPVPSETDATGDQGGDRFEIERVQAVNAASDVVSESMRDAERRQGLHFSRTFLTTTSVYAFDTGNQVRAFRLESEGAVGGSTPPRRMPPANGDVLGLTTCSLGIVAEMDDAVEVLSESRWQTVFGEPVFSVRGYPGSKWYRNMLTFVGQARTDICFLGL